MRPIARTRACTLHARSTARPPRVTLVAVLLLIDDRFGREPEPEPRRPDRARVPWRVVPSLSATVACLSVAITTDGAVGLVATVAGFAAACRALDRALPYGSGLAEHRQ